MFEKQSSDKVLASKQQIRVQLTKTIRGVDSATVKLLSGPVDLLMDVVLALFMLNPFVAGLLSYTLTIIISYDLYEPTY